MKFFDHSFVINYYYQPKMKENMSTDMQKGNIYRKVTAFLRNLVPDSRTLAVEFIFGSLNAAR